jgi:arylsulfate sulfotransferase
MSWLEGKTHNGIICRMKVLASLSLGILVLSNCGGTKVTTQIITGTIQPNAVSVTLQSVQNFTASFGAATWSINGVAGGNATLGTIDSQGVYTAPADLPSPNVLTLTATSVSDPTLTASATLTIVYPAPQLTSLTPATVRTGSGDTVVTVTGSNFLSTATAGINGSSLATTFVSSIQLTVTVPAAMLANPAALNLVIANQPAGKGLAATLIMTVVSTGHVTLTANLLVANYAISSPRDATMSVEFGPDTNYGLKTWSQLVPTGGGTINMLVAGMRAATTYHMRATLEFPDGTEFVDSDKTFTTGTVDPLILPQVTVTNPSGLMPSPGVLFGNLYNTAGAAGRINVPVFDMQGNVIWYYDSGSTGSAQPVKLLPNGHLLVNLSGDVREIDLAGNIYKEFTASDVKQWLTNAGYDIPVASIHHDFLMLPNGHLILLVSTVKTFNSLSGYTGPTDASGDVLVDLDSDYNVAWVWSTFDHLDVNRHPAGLPDWTHGNAVIYSPDDGNILYSSRHQSWIIKIDYRDGAGTGNVLWRLGYQGDFTIDSGLNPDWQFAQHFPIIVSPNSEGLFNLMVYDNGDNRVLDNVGTVCGNVGTFGPQLPGTIQCYTRAVNFQVNETTKTVSTAWQFNTSPVYSFWGGSTQLLSTGNYVVDLNAPADIDSSGNPILPLDNHAGSRYLELTPDQPPQVVMQMEITDQNAYRLVHAPSLYPGVQW